MSILKKLSDVLKEVFWIKSARAKRSSSKSRKIPKKSVKKSSIKPKSKALPVKKALPRKTLKVLKPASAQKLPKVKKLPKDKRPPLDPALVKVGVITHYFERINVCVVKITQGTILIGDKLTIAGPKNRFIQKVWSMQVESQDVKVAKKGQLIGLKVDKPTAVEDIVYK